MRTTDVCILGAGLAGLTIAYLLRDSGLKVTICESRDRIGGRIHTLGMEENKPIELGATWAGSKHHKLMALLQELGLETFDQEMGGRAIFEPISTSPPYLATIPPNPEPTLRIKGGTMGIIHRLREKLQSEDVILDFKVEKIYKDDHQIAVSSKQGRLMAKQVVSTLPPNLLVNTIQFLPALPEALIAKAKDTHTWMGESIKIALTYKTPFWKTEKSSGTIISNVGPVPEMYDHSNFEETYFALKGFLNGNYYALSKEERIAMILAQLKKYYGPIVESYTSYHETVWAKESECYYPYENHVLPHQNQGDLIYHKDYYEGQFILAGTETSVHFPGYMEGAIHSAEVAVHKIKALS